MTQAHLAPGEQKILKQLEVANTAYKDLRTSADLSDSILSEYLRRLQQSRLIRREPDRKYSLVAEGRDALRRSDDIAIVSKTGRLLLGEIEPRREYDHPCIFPIDVSIYVGPEIERRIEEIQEEPDMERTGPVSKDEAKQLLLVQAASEVSRIFEDLFYRRFAGMVDDWRVHSIQRMNPVERRAMLRRTHRIALLEANGSHERELSERTLDDIERMYMRRKLPDNVQPPNLAAMMDFEAALVVSVSPAKLKKSAERVKNRFALFLLGLARDSDYSAPRILDDMTRAGIIPPQELQDYRTAKGGKQRSRVIQRLWAKYHKLAWGTDTEQMMIEVIPWRAKTRARHRRRK
jgi:DNA-binding HxlR family transcriptional regulator